MTKRYSGEHCTIEIKNGRGEVTARIPGYWIFHNGAWMKITVPVR